MLPPKGLQPGVECQLSRGSLRAPSVHQASQNFTNQNEIERSIEFVNAHPFIKRVIKKSGPGGSFHLHMSGNRTFKQSFIFNTREKKINNIAKKKLSGSGKI